MVQDIEEAPSPLSVLKSTQEQKRTCKIKSYSLICISQVSIHYLKKWVHWRLVSRKLRLSHLKDNCFLKDLNFLNLSTVHIGIKVGLFEPWALNGLLIEWYELVYEGGTPKNLSIWSKERVRVSLQTLLMKLVYFFLRIIIFRPYRLFSSSSFLLSMVGLYAVRWGA